MRLAPGWGVFGLLALSLSVAACREDDPRGRPRRVEIAVPVTERLEPSLRAVLDEALADVRRLEADSSIAEETLGRAYGELGRRYHASELNEAAISCYVNAEALLPRDHRWPYLLGQVHYSTYDLERARASFERVRELRPDDVPTLIALGQIHREQRRFDEALGLAREALDRRPDSAGAMLLMAELATDRGDHADAVEWYERLLRGQPGATRLYQPLAMAYRSLGQMEQAKEAFQSRGEGRTSIDDPLMAQLRDLRSPARLHASRGVSAFGRGDYEDAEAAFRLAVEAEPNDLAARLNLGSSLVMIGRLEEAISTYRELLELDPNHAMAHFNLGVVLSRVGKDQECLEHYREALRIDPEYRDPRFNLAIVLRRAGRLDEALNHFRRLNEMEPGNGSARLGEVLCLTGQQRFAEALERLEEGMRVLPADHRFIQTTARLLAACPEDAIRDGSRALELAQGLVSGRRSVRSLETLAMALAEIGQYVEAVRTQREAISMAEEGGGTDLLDRLRGSLERYELGEPCRDPNLG